MTWRPATIEHVEQILKRDLAQCDAPQKDIYKKFAVSPFLAPISRYGQLESVVVVARNHDEVIYWEDVEEGFNVSHIQKDGRLAEHWCNQDELGLALNYWIEDRPHPARLAPSRTQS